MAKIRKRGDSWQIDYFDPTGKRVRQSFPTKKEAEGELSKRVFDLVNKQLLPGISSPMIMATDI